ncbi:MAG: copper homeostasis protein CutC, partial [Nocardioides sp.]
MGKALLEVLVRHPGDVPGADEGGADRLHLVGEPATTGTLSPEPALVSSLCRVTELPVFVMLRLDDSWTTTGGELTRLVGLAEDYLGCGAAGVSFGFLDPDLEVDVEVCRHLAERLPNVP